MDGVFGSFFQELSFRLDIVREANVKLNKFLAPDFNVFNLMYIDENKMSDLLAFLLDPEGTHGQGVVFLNLFLGMLNDHLEVVPGGQKVKVSREAQTYFIVNNKRRIDLLLELGNICIAIENKLWSGEQDKQLADYSMHLSKAAPGSCLIFLTPDGRSPESVDLTSLPPNVKLCNWSYSNIAHWISECTQACDSLRVKWFLEELKMYILDSVTQN